VSIANFAYTPDRVTVKVNDTVRWRWDGPDTNHSVTSKSGQKESFDSDPGKAVAAIDHSVGFTFKHKFTKVGTFTYFCKVHGFTAKITVTKPTTHKKKKKKKKKKKTGSKPKTSTPAPSPSPPVYTPPKY
jgi:plastocyanin